MNITPQEMPEVSSRTLSYPHKGFFDVTIYNHLAFPPIEYFVFRFVPQRNYCSVRNAIDVVQRTTYAPPRRKYAVRKLLWLVTWKIPSSVGAHEYRNSTNSTVKAGGGHPQHNYLPSIERRSGGETNEEETVGKHSGL